MTLAADSATDKVGKDRSDPTSVTRDKIAAGPPTWASPGQAARVCTHLPNLRRTAIIAARDGAYRSGGDERAPRHEFRPDHRIGAVSIYYIP
ncbi:MAG: hypothetical protein ACYCS7_04885 [Acidimicrobiales bacterium]